MKSKRRHPQQFTSLLMLPITVHEAKKLAHIAANPSIPADEPYDVGDVLRAQVELLLGVAAIEDSAIRQLTALQAVETIFTFTHACSEAVIRYVSDLYGEDASTNV
jgi:hypothetical protein